jgi:hypothetical protein
MFAHLSNETGSHCAPPQAHPQNEHAELTSPANTGRAMCIALIMLVHSTASDETNGNMPPIFGKVQTFSAC